MGNIKPIGSEKLQGIEKINRILQIARYNESIPNPVNESVSNHYNIKLSDGHVYSIEKEKNGYVIKKTINEGSTDYLEPMKNRKYYNSYSQAFKRLNLIVKEVNTLSGNNQNVSLFGEQKKFVLKTPKPQPSEDPMIPSPADMPPAPMPEPAVPGDDLPSDDMGMGEPEMGGEEMPTDDMGMDEPDMGMETPDDEGNDDAVSFKSVQKLTGKLGQKLRKLNQGEEPISSDDTKYVLNSILSALDLSVLSDEDIEEIIGRFEDSEFEDDDEPSNDMDMEDPEMEDPEMDIPEGEMFEGESDEQWEGTMDGEYDLGFKSEPKEMNYDKFVKNSYASTIKQKMGDMMEDSDIDGLGEIFDSVFSESKVDNIIKSYFVESNSEKKFLQEQNQRKFLTEKTKKIKTMREVKNLSESHLQEVTSDKFLNRYKTAVFIGKTNKKNLVFEVNGKQFKITTDGAIL